jgi:membrane-associated phospholipid phosphatase
MRRVRVSEWVLIGYFVYAAVLAQALPVAPVLRLVTVGVNSAVVAGFALLAWGESLRGRRFFSILRDWYTPPLMLLAYREMGWFAPKEHTHELERAWVVWDRTLLDEWGLRAAIESLGPLLPSLLEASYLLTYSIPLFAMAILYAHGQRQRVESFLIIFLLAILSAYALFPYFPSEPPRRVFPGELFPSFETLFRRLNWALLGGYGIHTSVFPSGHVAGAFAGAFAMLRLLPERRWVGWLLLGLAVSITTATVYGRYHYTADAVAGFAISVGALAAGAALERRAERSLLGS